MILLAAAVANEQLAADSVTLTTGEKITGTIKSETDTDVTIEVPVSTTIIDERVIQKSDISKIDKEQPDEVAYKALIAVQPNAQYSLASDSYMDILSSLNAFQTQYPTSSYLPEIKKLAAAFQDEKDRVDKGEVKYLGQWLSPDEATKRQVQIAGVAYYNTMQQQAAAGDLVTAMQTFAAIEKDYAGTRIYPPAVALAQQVLARLKQDLAVRMQQVKADQDQLKKTIAFTAYPEKTNVIGAAKAERDRNNAVIMEALRSGTRWVPLIPRSALSIDTLQKNAISEAARLSTAPVAAMMESIQKVDAARAAANVRDYTTAETLLNAATALWSQNEDARYEMDHMRDEMTNAMPEATPAPRPSPSPTPMAVETPIPAAAPGPVEVAIGTAPVPFPAEPKPFYMTISGAVGIAEVVLIAGGAASIYGKPMAARGAGQ